MLLVKNTKPRIHTVHSAAPDGKIDIVVLHPGVNKAPAAWDRARKHPLVAMAIEEGELVEIDTAPQQPGKDGPAEGLMGAPEKQAIATIRETVQAPLLQEWLASEKREAVIKALMDQLDNIDPRKDKGKAK